MDKLKAILLVLILSLGVATYYLYSQNKKVVCERDIALAQAKTNQAAIAKPATATASSSTTINIKKGGLTEKQIQDLKDLCDSLQIRNDILNQALNNIQDTPDEITITQNNENGSTGPAYPAIGNPAVEQPPSYIVPNSRLRSVGMLVIKDGQDKKLGLAMDLDLGTKWELNAGLSSDLIFGGVLYKF
jgi:hypothetical protein